MCDNADTRTGCRMDEISGAAANLARHAAEGYSDMAVGANACGDYLTARLYAHDCAATTRAARALSNTARNKPHEKQAVDCAERANAALERARIACDLPKGYFD